MGEYVCKIVLVGYLFGGIVLAFIYVHPLYLQLPHCSAFLCLCFPVFVSHSLTLCIFVFILMNPRPAFLSPPLFLLFDFPVVSLPPLSVSFVSLFWFSFLFLTSCFSFSHSPILLTHCFPQTPSFCLSLLFAIFFFH